MRVYTSLKEQRFMCSVKDIKYGLCGLMVVLFTSLLSACDVEDVIALGALEIDKVTSDAIHCNIDIDGDIPFDCGFYYATTRIGVESKSASKVEATHEAHGISGVIDGLIPNTTYFVRGYAMTTRGWIYSDIVSVKTTARPPQSNDNKYPDIDY